jgi:formamidopyrimidine-DNA glycosylase
MPELPEVEFARGCLSRWAVGRTLVRVEGSRTRVLRGLSKKALAVLAGRAVQAVERRGKWLVLRLDGGLGLVAHLGMTGKFERDEPGAPPVRWSRVRFVLSDGRVLHYRDPRMFGEIRAGSLEKLVQDLPELGPDALGISARELKPLLAGRRRPIKDLLMDQRVLAGLGNIYATEALFSARIHPARQGGALSDREVERLARAITRSLEKMLDRSGGDRITYVEEARHTNPFLVYGRARTPCPRCGTRLSKRTIGGRTSVFCPTCQPARPGQMSRRRNGAKG